MNARLINTDPAILHRHADTCSAVAFLFLETSGKYFDLQLDAAKSSLNSFREHGDLLATSANGTDLVAGHAEMLTKSFAESGRLLRQGLALSTECQRQFGQLMQEGWQQFAEAQKQFSAAQLSLATRLGPSFALPRG